jgi:hypothetical protein
LLLHRHSTLGKRFPVSGGMMGPGFVPRRQIFKLHVKNGGLDCVQTGIQTFLGVLIFLPLTIVAQPPHPFGQIGIVRGNQTTIAVGTKVLAGIEAKTAGRAD